MARARAERTFATPAELHVLKAVSAHPHDFRRDRARWHASCSSPGRGSRKTDHERQSGALIVKRGQRAVKDFAEENAAFIEAQPGLELEIGCLVAAASDWTEDEMELDDLVCNLIDSGQIQLRIG